MARLLLAAFCDDVRTEVGQKHSLMGLFDTMSTADLAEPLPSFHLFARLGLDDAARHEATVELHDARCGVHLQLKAVVQGPVRDEASGLHVSTLNVGLVGLRLPHAGIYHAAFVIGGQRLGGPSFALRLVEPPTVQ